MVGKVEYPKLNHDFCTNNWFFIAQKGHSEFWLLKNMNQIFVISLKFHLLPCSLCTLLVKKRLEGGSSGQMAGKAAWLRLC